MADGCGKRCLYCFSLRSCCQAVRLSLSFIRVVHRIVLYFVNLSRPPNQAVVVADSSPTRICFCYNCRQSAGNIKFSAGTYLQAFVIFV